MRRPAALAALLVFSAGGAHAADMAAHRALYTLALTAGGSGDVVSASGTMGYEVIDACDGWAVRQRLQMTVTNRDGQDIQMVSDYATWEAKDGSSFRYHMKQTTDEAVTSETDGDAKLDGPGGPGSAHYGSPSDATVALPKGTLFPMAHTEALLRAAQDGKKFLSVPLFDGTVDSGAQDSFVTVLGTSGPTPSKWPDLASLSTARVHISFFDRKPESVTPDYEVTMKYWANGVADDLVMNFGDFSVSGTMVEFAPQPHPC